MPSMRRVKFLASVVAVSVFLILYLTNNARRMQTQDFYSTTVNAMDTQDASDEDTSRKLEDARLSAKARSQERLQSPTTSESPVMAKISGQTTVEEKSVAGRMKMVKGGERWDVATGKEAAMVVDKKGGGSGVNGEKEETKEEHEVEVELNAILKKGPIIIFSKTTCPYSRKAKAILLEKYTIVPAPFVVELNEHHLGQGLQSALAKSTGRRTVPNILINGKSIGGGDDVEALDTQDELIDKVKSMGGKRIVEAKLTK